MGIVEDIVTVSKTGKCFNHSDARSADKICEGSKAFLLENAKQFVFNHLHEPMLKCLGFDATPLTTTQMRQFSFNGKRLVRKSKQLGDFVCVVACSCRFQMANAVWFLPNLLAWQIKR